MGKFRIGVRVAFIAVLPLLGLLAISTVLLVEKHAATASLASLLPLTDLTRDAGNLVHELQKERGMTNGFISSKGQQFRDEIGAQRKLTDDRLKAYNVRLRSLDIGAYGGDLVIQLQQAEKDLARLDTVRQNATALAISPEQSFSYYTGVIHNLLDAADDTAIVATDVQVARGILAYFSIMAGKERAGQERAIGAAGFGAGKFDQDQLRRYLLLGAEQQTFFDFFRNYATEPQIAFYRQTMSAEANAEVERIRKIAAQGGIEGNLAGITAPAWFKSATARIDMLKQVEDRLGEDLQTTTAELHARAAIAFNIVLAILLGLGLTTATAAVAIIRGITRPVRALTTTMERLASGNLNIDVPGASRRDELGQMAKAVEVFKQNGLERNRLEAERSAHEARATEEKRAALVGMGETIEREAQTAMESVGTRTTEMATMAEEMNASATHAGESAQAAATAAGEALATAQTVASAAEQLTASVREIGNQVSQSTTIVGQAVAAGDEARTTMLTLNEKVSRIDAVAGLIAEIAARTNLLALNATIEAARAGDAGKGFAVVAGEVKQLAAQTARATEEITRHIAEVRSATTASVATVDQIEETIGKVNAIASSIAAAVEQQGAATAEIARSVSETAAAANEVTVRIGEVSNEAQRTQDRSTQVRDHTTALNSLVVELKRALIRAVRTSTAEVDRRQFERHAVVLPCRVTVSGAGSQTARTTDLSEQGAALVDGPALPIGARGVLDIDRVAIPLPFIVRAADDKGLHLRFDIGEETAAQLRTRLAQLEFKHAA